MLAYADLYIAWRETVLTAMEAVINLYRRTQIRTVSLDLVDLQLS
jgi:hypothetical protein